MKQKVIETVTGEKITLTENERKFFVCATDKLLSGWGRADRKTAKRVIICEDRQQAEIMCERLRRPYSGMKYVNYSISAFGPRYSSNKFVVSYDVFSDRLFNYK